MMTKKRMHAATHLLDLLRDLMQLLISLRQQLTWERVPDFLVPLA